MSNNDSSQPGTMPNTPGEDFATPRSSTEALPSAPEATTIEGGEHIAAENRGGEGIVRENVTRDHVLMDIDSSLPSTLAPGGEQSASPAAGDETTTKTSVAADTDVTVTHNPLVHVSPGSKPKATAGPASSPAPVPQTNPSSVRADKELARFTEVLQQTSPEVAQKALRENWRVFLFSGNDPVEHLSFILRAGFKNAPATVVERVLKEGGIFKDVLVKIASRKKVVVENVLSNVNAGQLLDHVPEPVIDKMLSDRLKNVPAKEIIRWLAEANRLGYKEDDILDDEDESVMPNIQSEDSHDGDVEMARDVPQALAHPDTDPLLAEQERNLSVAQEVGQVVRARYEAVGPLHCPTCQSKLGSLSGYNYVNLPCVNWEKANLSSTLQRSCVIRLEESLLVQTVRKVFQESRVSNTYDCPFPRKI